MKKMDVDGDRTVSREEFLLFTLNRISEGEFADAPLHIKAMGLNSGGSQMFNSTSSGVSSSFGHSQPNKQPESRKTAEKAYKTALMLLVREKNQLERELKTLQVVHKRAKKRILDLESKVQKGFGEIKRLRTMYKTSQKQIAKNKASQNHLSKHSSLSNNNMETGGSMVGIETQEALDKTNIIKRKQRNIKEQLPLEGLLNHVFHREPALITMLTQAREDNDMEEVTMLVLRCRVFVSFSQSLSKCIKYEDICTSVLEYVPNMLECDRAYLMLPKTGENDDVWTVLHRGGTKSTISQQHVGIHGKVQHTAQNVLIEDVDVDADYDPSVEMEGKANVGTRCVMAMPILYNNNEHNNISHKSLELDQSNQSVASIPPSFDPEPGKSHSKPIIGILEVINKKIRSGHGLPDKELNMKATAAVFGAHDVAFGNIIRKSLSCAISRIRVVESMNAQSNYLLRLSMVSFP